MEFAHSRAISPRQSVPEHQELTARVRAEYREMPGLCLTLAQAARLLGLNQGVCVHLFRALVREGFLRETPRGDFVLAD
jgi:hypothetical protein